MHLGCATEDLEVARDDVDLDVEVADRADVREHALVRVVRESDDHALDPVLANELAEAVGTAEEEGKSLRELVVQLGGPVVHEADQADPVLAVVDQLESKLLTDVARADDHRVLCVAGQMPAEGSSDGAERRDQEQGQQPEDREPSQDGLHEVCRDPEEREDPDSDRDAAKHTDDVVDRRMIGPLLVPVVEALEPEQEHPARDGEEECQVLEARGDPVPRVSDGRHERARENEGECEPHDVGDEQRPPYEGSPPIPAPRQRRLDRLLFRCVDEVGRELAADTPAVDREALAHPSPFSDVPERRSAPVPITPRLPLAARDPSSRAPQRYSFETEAQVRSQRRGRRRPPFGLARRRPVVTTYVIALGRRG